MTIVDENNVIFNALSKNGFKTVKNIKGTNKKRNKFYDQISYYKTSDLGFDWKELENKEDEDQNNIDSDHSPKLRTVFSLS